MAATAKALDMTDVKEGGNFNKKRIPSGDYLAKVLKVEDAQVKKGDNQGADQWLFTVQIVKFPSAKYPYYCTLVPNQLWKVRNLAVACGMTVPKKRFKLDPNKLVGKNIGVSIEDTEYDGRDQSEITGVFPAAELEDYDGPTGTNDSEDDGDDGDEDEAPARRPAKKASRPAPEPEDDEEEEETEEEDEASGDEFDAMDRSELKEYLKTADPSFVAKKSQSDDDLRALARAVDLGGDEEDEEEDEEPEPAPVKRTAKKAARKPAVSDEDLDELDLDDL